MSLPIAAILLLTCTLSLTAQERATTASGRIVLLYPDGTWKYAPPAVNLPMSGRTRPSTATEHIDLARGRAALYFDPSKWKVTKSEEAGRMTLSHTNGDGYALVLAERIQVSLGGLRKIALDNAKDAAPDARIVSEEHRTVNGVDILAMRIEGTIQGLAFAYFGYYYAGKEGTFQVLTYTAVNLFDEYRPDFENLLDGFVLVP